MYQDANHNYAPSTSVCSAPTTNLYSTQEYGTACYTIAVWLVFPLFCDQAARVCTASNVLEPERLARDIWKQLKLNTDSYAAIPGVVAAFVELNVSQMVSTHHKFALQTLLTDECVAGQEQLSVAYIQLGQVISLFQRYKPLPDMLHQMVHLLSCGRQWFHGQLPALKAESALKRCKTAGSFLVRNGSQPGSLSISFLTKSGSVKHMRVVSWPDGAGWMRVLKYGQRRTVWPRFQDVLKDPEFAQYCRVGCVGVKSWLASRRKQLPDFVDPYAEAEDDQQDVTGVYCIKGLQIPLGLLFSISKDQMMLSKQHKLSTDLNCSVLGCKIWIYARTGDVRMLSQDSSLRNRHVLFNFMLSKRKILCSTLR